MLFVVAALAGWAPGHGFVMALSAAQVVAPGLKRMPWNQGREVRPN